MSTALMVAAALLAQSAIPAQPASGEGADRIDVAYAELSQGRNEEAIVRITENRQIDAGDPAALLNLGAAYARTGRENDARRCFERAVASREHYDLELANGQWMNSRQAARKAIVQLRDRQTLALASRR